MKELLTQFDKMTLALAKDGSVIKQELTPEQANLLHMSVGISGEAGELLDAIKKHVVYQKPLDVENVKEELGDLLFYMSNLMQSVGLTFEEILQHNINKLSVRYSSGSYSNQQAQERADKVGGENGINLETLSNDYLELCQKVGKFNKEAMVWMLNEAPKCKWFSDSDSLYCSFDWSDTPQGDDFWYNISETLKQVKEV